MIQQDYVTIKAISHTCLTKFEQSPLHYQHYLEKGIETTKSMEIGMLFKIAVLNPSEFESQYFKMPSADRRTIGGKLQAKVSIAENEGKTGIPFDIYTIIEKMRESVYSQGLASKLLNSNHQTTIFWMTKTLWCHAKQLYPL